MLAQRDIPLSSPFRAYHLGHAMFVRLGIEVIAELDPAQHLPLTQRLLGRSVDFIDKVCEQVGQAYEAERDQWVGDRGGIRQHWVAEALSGRALDTGEAEAALGYRFAGTHLGVQMWVPAKVAGVDARTAFEEARRALASVLSPVAPPLVVPRDEREMHVWFPIRSDAAIPGSLESLVPKSLKVQVAIGRPESGIDGFRRTSDQAKRVKDVLLISAASLPKAVTYDELGAVALMITDVDALRRFVLRMLGSLAKNGEREDTLRETLLAFLAHNRSYAATAKAMVLHRNSVQYRVQRALELCERDLNDADVALDVHTALTAAHWLGRAVLSPA
jgi:DNA-binding PucR family transcriptional regulator